MATATVSLLAFLVLAVWRFVFAGLSYRRLPRKFDPLQQQRNGFLEDLQILDPGLCVLHSGSLIVPAMELPNCDDTDFIAQRDRAETYLRRIVALTGATKSGNRYFLHVGTTRFELCNGSVRRLRTLTDRESVDEETCFYPALQGMPKAERLATALLQLKNNRALFDRWAAQNDMAFKADGQVFTRAR
jgi:hypothetical protein